MSTNFGLKKDLSMGLQDALKASLLPNENIVISLPGSFGEGFAVSDRRAFVVRDCESGLDAKCRVFSYQLSQVTGAEAASSSTGGYIELKLVTPVAEQDEARIYFPSYDLGTFKSAADYVNNAVAGQVAQSPAASPTTSGPAEPANGSCPKCGAAISGNSTFCGQCGEQLMQICSECSTASPAGTKFCEGCGRELVAFNPNCAKCGARLLKWMRYCTECGSIQEQACIACGTALQPSWQYCANCGRLIGSDRLDPRAAMAAQRRLQQLKDAEEERAQAPASAPEYTPEPVAAPVSATTADEVNKRGLKYFEDGELENAINDFKTAVQLDPNNPSYHCNLAVAYDENDEDELAIQEYYKTLELDPKDLTALLSLGYMYNENLEHDKAEEVWNKVLEIAPDSAEAQEVRDNLRHQGEL